MDAAAKNLSYELFPGLHKPLGSDDLTDALRAATFKYLGYEVGLRHWRDVQVHFSQRFTRCPTDTSSTSAQCAQRGHNEETERRYYANSDDLPIGVPYGVMRSQLRASRLWQDLTGSWLYSTSRTRWLIGALQE